MKNIFLILFFSFLLVSCQDKKPAPDALPKFEWKAAICAPVGYEASANATYIFGNNHNNSFSADSPYIYTGWGVYGSVISGGSTNIPTEVKINWLSKAEGKYYKATVKIDTLKIKQLIAKGCGVNEYTKKREQYSFIMSGVAPGGVAAVWLGKDIETVEMVGWAKGEEDLNPPMISEIDYRDEVKKYKEKTFLGRTDDKNAEELVDIDFVAKHGIIYGSWDYYPKKYNWQPVVLSNKGYEIKGDQQEY